MRYRIWHTAALALLLGAQGSLGTTEVRASGLVDWMSRCGRPAEPQIVCYPMTTDCCEPSVCCQSPDPVYQPQPSFASQGCWGSRATQPLLGGGVPQTYYRTSWKKIPVTSYRPAVSTDPVTGCPVTVMKPCVTYTWQAERRQCGFFGRLFGWCDPPAAQVECCMPTTCCGSSDYGMSAVSSGCCEPTMQSISPSPTPAPYYTPNPPSVLTVPQGSGMPTLAPGAPPAAYGIPQGTQPPAAADVRPTLKPADVPPSAASPQPGLPWENAAPAQRATTDPQALEPMPSLGPPEVDPGQSRLNPVPDPNATPVSPVEEEEPPPLLHPRDQVASLRTGQHWAVTPIVWPASRRNTQDRTSAPGARRDLREWDESGWQSARKAP